MRGISLSGLGILSTELKHPNGPRKDDDPLRKPTVFIDGSAWAFSFSLGVVKHLQKEYDTRDWDVIALSAGNIGGLCMALVDFAHAQAHKQAHKYTHTHTPI